MTNHFDGWINVYKPKNITSFNVIRKINKILNQSSQDLISYSDNPYGDGGATDKILNILKKYYTSTKNTKTINT